MKPKRTALLPQDNPRLEAYLDLVRTYEALSGVFREGFKAHDVTSQQYNVLRILYVRDPDRAGMSCQEIGARLVHKVPDITRLLDRLEASGWVARERSSEDRRVVLTWLTDAGFAKVEAVHPDLLALHDATLAHLSDRDLASLRKLLQKARTPS